MRGQVWWPPAIPCQAGMGEGPQPRGRETQQPEWDRRPFPPALVRTCHMGCNDRPSRARAEAAKVGPGRKKEPGLDSKGGKEAEEGRRPGRELSTRLGGVVGVRSFRSRV